VQLEARGVSTPTTRLTTHASVAIPTLTLRGASEAVDPQNPMIVRASAQAIRRCWRWRSMCVASQSLLAHDRPMYTQNASEEWAPMTTAGAVAGRCREDTARAPGRTWMTCEGTTKCRLGRHQCMRTRGRGSAHRVGAGSDVGSMSKDDRAGLPVPPPPATLGVLPPKRLCKQRMIPGWLSGHA
jgi:hypothetical protein